MGKLLKFKQFWCYNFAFGHRNGSADDLELTVTWHPYNKKFEVKITNECVKCGAEILLSIEFLTPSEYVRFNSKHLLTSLSKYTLMSAYMTIRSSQRVLKRGSE